MRSAIIVSKNDDSDLEFNPFPDDSIGEKGFMRRCNVGCGVRLDLCGGRWIAKSETSGLIYKVWRKIKGVDLVTQHSLKLSDFGDRVINTNGCRDI